MKTTNIDAWLKSGEYLPEVLRDFHDQKDVFKAMHEIIQEPDPKEFIKRPNWIEGQCYVIDMFLWFMARRGYTLQRTRRRGDFRDLVADVRAQTEKRDAECVAALKQALEKPNDRVEGRDAALSRRVPSHDGLAGTVPPGLTLKGHAMFDEHPDGDPHGECAAEIHRLQSLNDEALDLLATMFDAYEDGPDCYEDPEDCAGHLGKAVNLDDAVFDRIADILNEHRPRNSVVTANVV